MVKYVVFFFVCLFEQNEGKIEREEKVKNEKEKEFY